MTCRWSTTLQGSSWCQASPGTWPWSSGCQPWSLPSTFVPPFSVPILNYGQFLSSAMFWQGWLWLTGLGGEFSVSAPTLESLHHFSSSGLDFNFQSMDIPFPSQKTISWTNKKQRWLSGTTQPLPIQQLLRVRYQRTTHQSMLNVQSSQTAIPVLMNTMTL